MIPGANTISGNSSAAGAKGAERAVSPSAGDLEGGIP